MTLGVVVPLMAGYLLELMLIMPLSVDAEEEPIWFPLQVRCPQQVWGSVLCATNRKGRRARFRACACCAQTWPLGLMATQFFYWAVMPFQPAPLYDVLRTVRGACGRRACGAAAGAHTA